MNEEDLKQLQFDKNSKVVVYEGKAGAYKATMNSLKAKGILRIFEASYASLGEIMSVEEAEGIRRKFLKRKLKIREITNQAYHEVYTKVEGYNEKVMDIRYINPTRLKVDVETLIYNDVISYYTYKGEGLFCVEIYNERLAEMEKQVFDFIWKHGDRPIIGKGGRTSIF